MPVRTQAPVKKPGLTIYIGQASTNGHRCAPLDLRCIERIGVGTYI